MQEDICGSLVPKTKIPGNDDFSSINPMRTLNLDPNVNNRVPTDMACAASLSQRVHNTKPSHTSTCHSRNSDSVPSSFCGMKEHSCRVPNGRRHPRERTELQISWMSLNPSANLELKIYSSTIHDASQSQSCLQTVAAHVTLMYLMNHDLPTAIIYNRNVTTMWHCIYVHTTYYFIFWPLLLLE